MNTAIAVERATAVGVHCPAVKLSHCMFILAALAGGCSVSYPTSATQAVLAGVRVDTLSNPTSVGGIVIGGLSTIDTDRVFRSVERTSVVWFSSDNAVLRPFGTTPGYFVAMAAGTAALYGTYLGFSDHVDVVVTGGPVLRLAPTVGPVGPPIAGAPPSANGFVASGFRNSPMSAGLGHDESAALAISRRD